MASGIKLSQEDFVAKATSIHGRKYSYELSEYINGKTKVRITCPTHGVFEQQPSNHLSGKGCPSCRHAETGDRCRGTSEQFISKAQAVHGGRYDYSKVVYISTHKKVSIVCQKHGAFEQKPSHHCAGSGCPVCGKSQTAKKLSKTQEEYVASASLVHEARYDYSLVQYKNSTTKIKIVCRLHGVWETSPASHLTGCGCPSCGTNGFSSNKVGTFYILTSGEVTKVGVTHRETDVRVDEIVKSSGINFSILKEYKGMAGNLCLDAETSVLQYLSSMYKSPKEKYDGSTESFYGVDLAGLLNRVEATLGN